jgi:hypothetical protein
MRRKEKERKKGRDRERKKKGQRKKEKDRDKELDTCKALVVQLVLRIVQHLTNSDFPKHHPQNEYTILALAGIL